MYILFYPIYNITKDINIIVQFQGADSYKACDVQTWLGCIQNETEPEPMDDATTQSMPDGINTISDSGSIDSKDSSSSIEIIQMPSSANLCKNYSSFV